MRQAFPVQHRLDCNPIENVPLNIECRDEIIPVLKGLQYVYSQSKLRGELTSLIASDVNANTRDDVGREGFTYWQIIVLAVVRMGCNLDYDKLQDLAENHRSLRQIMGIGDWEDGTNFNWRRIQENICLVKPSTFEKVNQLIVGKGQALHGNARSSIRADSFVIETNIHFPTESSLIWDGIRKIIPLCRSLADILDVSGWRQSTQLLKRIKQHARVISQISSSKSPKAKEALPTAYRKLIERAEAVIKRGKDLLASDQIGPAELLKAKEIEGWIELTEQVCDTAHRRVILGETVPNSEKLFSLFEIHTQLYRRGKAGTPNQFGRLLLVYEDGAGFISHYHLMDRNVQDADVVVQQTKRVQELHASEITSASFDRGFYSPENEKQLSELINSTCLPPRHPKQFAEKMASANIEFRQLRQRHPGVESAIGSLQSGNGLKRCRDRSELGMERYIAVAIVSRNLHILGKLLIAQEDELCEAARSKRKAA